MAYVIQCPLPVLTAIRVYWRTHDAEGEIPRSLQTWWAACYDHTGHLLTLPVDEDLVHASNNLVELVVAVGERLDTIVGIDQVKLDTGHRTAEWNQGA